MPPPENFWKYGCSEVQFGAFWSRNRIVSGLNISCFSKAANASDGYKRFTPTSGSLAHMRMKLRDCLLAE